MIRRLAAATAVALWTMPGAAQDSDRDPGFLAGLIEDQLNAPGLNVEIDGFSGALSSRASLDELRIADDAGVWLRMTDVVLDWNRSALLRGRLEVEELSAASIRLERTPLPPEGFEPPPAAAQGFSLPDLPVSIAIESLTAERIELGEAILGQEATLSLQASARLADGSGEVTLQATRIDGPEGVFALAASYDAATQILAVDLDVQEAEGGIAATRLGLPGAPAIDLSVQGAGPLDAFAAEIALASDGTPRVGGRVTLDGTDEGRRFDVDLGGDVTALLAPRYRPFFGDDVALEAQGVQLAAGGFALDRLALDTRALTLEGRARIGADGWPELLDVTGSLVSADGGPVLLPAGEANTVQRVDLTLLYDPATSDRWTMALTLADLRTAGTVVGSAEITADGTLTRAGGAVAAATGALEGVVAGLAFSDPALTDAVGERITLSAEIGYGAGEPVRVSDIRLSGSGYALSGDASADRIAAEDGTTTLPVTLDLDATFEDLAALAGAAGIELTGAAEATVAGTVAPLSGTFDLDVDAATDALGLGIAQVDPLLAGRTTLAVNARRTDQGTFLDGLRLANDQLEAEASFTIFGEGTEAREAGQTGAAQVRARLYDGASIDPRLAGETTLDADVTQAEDGTWSGRVDATGPAGLTLSADGVLTGPAPDVTFAARAPDLTPFVDGIPGGVTLDGRASATGGVWSVMADATGPWDLTARVEGPVTGDAPRVAFEAQLPRAADPVPALADIPPLAGATSLSGTASQSGGVWSVNAEARTDAGVVATVDGPVTGPAPRIDVTARVPDIAAFSPALNGVEALQGPADLDGTVAQANGAWNVEATLRTDAGIAAEVEGALTGGLDLTFDATVPDLSGFSAALEGIEPLATSARLMGRLAQDGETTTIDARAETESGIVATVAGPLTGEERSIAFDLRVPDVAAFSDALDGIEPLQGPASLTGTATQADDAWSLDAALRTDGGIALDVTGPVTGPSPRVTFDLSVPDAAAFSDALDGVEPLQGRATVAGVAAQEGGVWSVDVSLDTAGGLSASVEGPVTGDAARIVFDARIPDVTGLSPAIADVHALRGPASVEGVVAQEGGTWTADVALTSEAGIEATVSGPLTGADARIAFDARVPDLSAFSPALAQVEPLQGAGTVSGVVAQVDGAWTLDIDVATDGGIAASVDGPVTGPAARVTFSASVPDLSAFSPALAEVEPLQGAADLSGVAAQSDGVWSVDVRLNTAGGIAAQVSGPVTGPDARIAFDARVPDVSAFSPALADIAPLQGPGAVTGTAAQQDGAWVLDVAITTDGGIEARIAGPATGPAPRIRFDASVPDVAAFAPPLAEIEPLVGPATLGGTLTQDDGTWRIDTRVDAPAGIVVRAEGDLTGPAGLALDVAATVPDLAPFADRVPAVPLEGALSLDASLRDTPEGLSINARATGPFGARATARTVLSGPLAASFTAAVPDLSRIVPSVPGGLDVSGDVRETDAGLELSVAGTGPYDVIFDAEIALPETGPVIEAQGRLPDAARIAPQVEGPVDFTVAARQVDGQWIVDADASGAGGLTASAEGVATGPEADLDVTLTAADVAPFVPGLLGQLAVNGRLFWQDNGYAFDLDASGPLGAALEASGQLTGRAPEARFDLRVPDIAPLVPDLRGPLRAQGTARQDGAAWAVDVDLDGPGGTTAMVTGSAGASSDLRIEGSVPLGLGNAVLAPQRVAGTARFDLALRGAPALENVTGTISTSGATLVLPTLRNGLEAIDATISLAGGRAAVDVSAGVESGGRVTLSGPVRLTSPFDADLAIRFDVNAEDPTLYTADVQGALTISGPLAGGARIAGGIVIDEAEIAVPSSGITAVGDIPAIQHVNVPRPVARTLDRAGQGAADVDAADGASGGGGPGYALDVTIDAPSRIFVRGRGLDAELGGRIVVQGTTTNPVVSGGFELIRGRLDILQQRFELDQGTITFQGDLVPYIQLAAVTQTDALTASIIVEGPATEPEVRFESSPDVPQEEILAQIFFGRDLSQLSPLQAIQLANSVAVLAGRGSGGLLDRLRGGAGLDDLDLTTDAEGNTAVRAGKYISENVYTDVQVGQGGDATVSLNIDLSPSLTVRGSAGAAGDTSVGLFFERDY